MSCLITGALHSDSSSLAQAAFPPRKTPYTHVVICRETKRAVLRVTECAQLRISSQFGGSQMYRMYDCSLAHHLRSSSGAVFARRALECGNLDINRGKVGHERVRDAIHFPSCVADDLLDS
jgi:hypothetical protein